MDKLEANATEELENEVVDTEESTETTEETNTEVVEEVTETTEETTETATEENAEENIEESEEEVIVLSSLEEPRLTVTSPRVSDTIVKGALITLPRVSWRL